MKAVWGIDKKRDTLILTCKYMLNSRKFPSLIIPVEALEKWGNWHF
jgi:hypothetical protein